MKKSFILIATSIVVFVVTLAFTMTSKPAPQEQVITREPSMVKPVINEAQF